jgi:phosphatidylserine synthase
LFDGRIARIIKKQSPLGKHLDSYADLISFCFAPAVLLYAIIWGDNGAYNELKGSLFYKSKLIGMAVSFLFPVAGAIRLARFSVLDEKQSEKKPYFYGIPSTMAGGICAIVLGFNYLPAFFQKTLYQISPAFVTFKTPAPVLIIVFLFYTYAMLAPFRFTKAKSSFLNFGKGSSVFQILKNIVFIAVIVLFSKYFLVIGAFFYSLKPFFTWDKLDKISYN